MTTLLIAALFVQDELSVEALKRHLSLDKTEVERLDPISRDIQQALQELARREAQEGPCPDVRPRHPYLNEARARIRAALSEHNRAPYDSSSAEGSRWANAGPSGSRSTSPTSTERG